MIQKSKFPNIFPQFSSGSLVRSLPNLVKLPGRTMILTNNTTTANLPPSTLVIDGHYFGYQYISPLNITIALYIIIQNSMIIYDYHKDWRRISCLFFILVASVDIGSACLEMGRGSISLLCFKDPSMRMHSWTFLTYQKFGVLCYVTSTFFVLVLTVVKTINIIRPFYRQNNRLLKIVLFIYPSILLVVSIIDVWFWNDLITIGRGDNPKCGVLRGPWIIITNLETIGQGTTHLVIRLIVRHFALPVGAAIRMWHIMEIVIVLVQFGLPCLIVIVCMVLQMIYIKKAFGGHENPMLNTANQVNLTVFLISLLYLSSVSLYFMVTYPLIVYTNQILPIPIQVLLQFTLPLVNTALFPTILILRKPEMRARYRNCIAKFLLLPLTIYGKVHHLAQRRRRYTDI